MVYLQVPQPLYHVDAELNAMAMLHFVMEDLRTSGFLEPAELQRVAGWFYQRYGR